MAPTQDQQLSPLFRLPGEIRNQVYSYLLGTSKTISVYRINPPLSSSSNDFWPQINPSAVSGRLLPLFLACQSLSLEARAYFYSQNAFFFPTPSRRNLNSLCRTFLDCIGEQNAAFIQQLCVPFPLEDPNAFVRWQEAPPEVMEGRLLFPGLPGRVPNLRVLEFIKGARAGVVMGMDLERDQLVIEEKRWLIRVIDGALRQEFPRLERVVVDVEEGEEEAVMGCNGWTTRLVREVEESRWKVFLPLGKTESMPVEEELVVLVNMPRRVRWKWKLMRSVGMEVSESERRKFLDDWRPLG